MTTINLPPDIEEPLAEAAVRQGTTPELLAIDTLRKEFIRPAAEASNGETLFDFLSGFVGAVEGPTEAFSEDCGARFTDALQEKQRQGRL